MGTKTDNKKVSCLIDKDVYKAFKQIQLDQDLKSISGAMRHNLKLDEPKK